MNVKKFYFHDENEKYPVNLYAADPLNQSNIKVALCQPTTCEQPTVSHENHTIGTKAQTTISTKYQVNNIYEKC